jgi:uncharacterized protein
LFSFYRWQMRFLIDGPEDGRTFVFAHGAGGAMDTPWMNEFARGLAEHGVRVLRFEFPYMAARREGGKKGAPDRQPVLLDSWRQAVAAAGPAETLIIGGKSMGGRMASMVADELGVRGLLCLGYPFHPPGDSSRLRVAHLETLRTPTMIIQGERDPFGTRDEVSAYKLSEVIRLEWITDGDHSYVPRKSGGRTRAGNVSAAFDAAATFIASM